MELQLGKADNPRIPINSTSVKNRPIIQGEDEKS